MAHELTLNNVKAKVREHRASDFLSDEQQEEVKKSNVKGNNSAKYSAVDAYIAEIIARFGYGAYMAWKNGEIDETTMAKFVIAERARETRNRLKLENIIVASVYGANHPTKQGHAPKSLKTAIKMLKSEEKLAKGGI